MVKRAYVYGIIVDGMVRYIGKGTGDRAKAHFARARAILEKISLGHKVKTNRFYNNLALAISMGAKVGIIYMEKNLTGVAALEREALEIEKLLHSGQLWNVLSGGGAGSYVISNDLRRKLSDIAKKRFADPAEKIKIGARIKVGKAAAAARDPAAYEIAKQSFLAWRNDPKKYKAAMSRRAKTVAATEWRNKASAKAKGLVTPQRRELFAAISKKSWAEKKENRRAALRRAWSRPETEEKHRDYLDSALGKANLSRAAKTRWDKQKSQKLERAICNMCCDYVYAKGMCQSHYKKAYQQTNRVRIAASRRQRKNNNR